MDSFEHKIERMKQIFRGQEAYCEGTPAQQANQFRTNEMLDEIIRRAKENSAYAGRPVNFLISLSGFSPDTTILTYEILRPEKVLVVFSEKANDSVNVIANAIVKPGKLSHRDFMHEECVPTDPLGIYQIVSEKLKKLYRAPVDRPNSVIDITGGKKVMSATAALAAWQLDLPLCYLDSQYDPELRQPVPGTENLLLLSNPTELFGDHEMQGALQTFRAGAYEAARVRYHDLSNRISEPAEARFMRDLSDVYRAWCDLDLDGLPDCIQRLEKHLVDPRINKFLTIDIANRLRAQVEFLRSLPSDERSLLLCYYVLGLHYVEIRRFDFAALLFYRTIEGCLVKRLELNYPGFRSHQPDYSAISADVNELLQRYNQTSALIRPGEPDATLPRRVGYMGSVGLLHATGDALLTRAQVKTPDALQHLHKLAEVRNRSVLAHGFESIRGDQSRELQGMALRILRAFWDLHSHDQNIDSLCETLQLIHPDSGIAVR